MKKTTTTTQGRVVPTEEFRDDVHELTKDVDEPVKNDGLVAYVYHRTDLNTDEAARLLDTSNVALTQASNRLRYRHYFRDIDTSTEYDDPLEDRELLERLVVVEGLCDCAIEAVLGTGYLQTREALRRHGLVGATVVHRNGDAFRVENLAENQTGYSSVSAGGLGPIQLSPSRHE